MSGYAVLVLILIISPLTWTQEVTDFITEVTFNDSTENESSSDVKPSVRALTTSKTPRNVEETALWPAMRVLQNLAVLEYSEAPDACASHTRNLLEALSNATYWAVQMVDASGHMPSGVMEGNTFSLGDFDECIAVEAPLEKSPVSGQYCLASLSLPSSSNEELKPRSLHDSLTTPPPFSSAWDHIKDRGERWRRPRNSITMALCVPSSCSPIQVQHAAQVTLATLGRSLSSNLTLEVSVPAPTCSTARDREPFGTSDVAFCCVVAVLLLLSFSSTIYDLASIDSKCQNDPTNPPSKSVAKRIFLCFAARKHFFDLTNEEKGEDNLNFLFGLRLASILFVILCHKIGFIAAGPTKNAIFQEQSFTQLHNMPVLHADLVVDTFFFLAGFLLTVGLMRALLRPEGRMAAAVWPIYLFRYIRLAPAYMLTIFFYATLLPRIGSGPFWKAIVVPERQYCVENWWINALFINNYYKVDSMCIEQSWYMPCDMHMFLVCVPLVVLLHKKPRLGLAALLILTLASVLAPFLTIWINNYDGMLLFFLDFLRASRKHPFFRDFYVKSHLRAGPYFIGVAIGWIFIKSRNKKVKTAWAIPLFVLGIFGVLACSLTGILFYDTEGPIATSLLSRAFYGSLHRTAWALAIGCMVLAIAMGKLRAVRAVLSWKPLIPFSKLSYGAYLVHIVVIWYGAGVVREPTYSSEFLMAVRTWGDTVATFMVALVLYLVVEAPIRDLMKLLLHRAKKEESASKKIEPVTMDIRPTIVTKNMIIYSL